ncbi:MAG: hypothetical protein AAF270_10860 [Pseudomonadota bacterium]
MKKINLLLVPIAFVCLTAACSGSASVNKSIKIEAGATSDGGSTVNGKVSVGPGAVVRGDLETVNGSISIAENVQAGAVESVNGRIQIDRGADIASSETVNGRNSIGPDSRVAGDVSTVNGLISVGSGSEVGGDISAVNGKIRLNNVMVNGNVENINGGMELKDGTRVAQSVIVRKPKSSGWSWGKKDKNKKPRIVIGRDVVIEGDLVLEQEVELYVHETAKIGAIVAEAIEVDMMRFSGDSP